MSKFKPYVVTSAITLAGALLSSAIMALVSPKASWLQFVGWVIFFAAIQTPLFLTRRSATANCTAWLSRLRGKG